MDVQEYARFLGSALVPPARFAEVRSAGRYAHSRFNATRLNGHRHEAAELFLICRP